TGTVGQGILAGLGSARPRQAAGADGADRSPGATLQPGCPGAGHAAQHRLSSLRPRAAETDPSAAGASAPNPAHSVAYSRDTLEGTCRRIRRRRATGFELLRG